MYAKWEGRDLALGPRPSDGEKSEDTDKEKWWQGLLGNRKCRSQQEKGPSEGINKWSEGHSRSEQRKGLRPGLCKETVKSRQGQLGGILGAKAVLPQLKEQQRGQGTQKQWLFAGGETEV